MNLTIRRFRDFAISAMTIAESLDHQITK